MKSSAKKVELASVDDLFTTEQERQEAGEERVVRIPLMQLHYFKGYPAMQTEIPFTGQPYRVKDDDPILAVERFWDNTRWMIEFRVQQPHAAYGSPGDEIRLFLTEDGYQAALASQQRREIKIKRYARVVEGHILDFKPKKKRHP